MCRKHPLRGVIAIDVDLQADQKTEVKQVDFVLRFDAYIRVCPQIAKIYPFCRPFVSVDTYP